MVIGRLCNIESKINIRRGDMDMKKDRIKKLLSNLMDITADMLELDGAMEIFIRIGFTEKELQEMGYGEE